MMKIFSRAVILLSARFSECIYWIYLKIQSHCSNHTSINDHSESVRATWHNIPDGGWRILVSHLCVRACVCVCVCVCVCMCVCLPSVFLIFFLEFLLGVWVISCQSDSWGTLVEQVVHTRTHSLILIWYNSSSVRHCPCVTQISCNSMYMQLQPTANPFLFNWILD